jgi:hypothetical protein
VIEGTDRIKDFLAEDEQALPRLRDAVEEDPENSEKRVRSVCADPKVGATSASISDALH